MKRLSMILVSLLITGCAKPSDESATPELSAAQCDQFIKEMILNRGLYPWSQTEIGGVTYNVGNDCKNKIRIRMYQ